MTLKAIQTQSSIALVGATCFVLGTGFPAVAFSPEPVFDQVDRFSTTIPTATGVNEADIYYPVSSPDTSVDSLPIVLLLQGALVDKADYSNFASNVAQYGFAVIVPNHVRTLTDPTTGQTFTGFFAEQQQVSDVLAFATATNTNPTSPIANLLDPDKLGLVGHSFGGAVGLSSIQDICFPSLCTDQFSRPEELMAGVFYGTTFRDPRLGGNIPPIKNDGIPVALVAGDRDGVVGDFAAVEATHEQIQDPPKALITIQGANHYGITNEDSPRDPVRPTLDQDVATEAIARWSGLFLRASLLNDADALDYIYNTGDALDENVSVTSEAATVPEPTSFPGILAFCIIGVAWKLRRSKKNKLHL
ncbi:chlorophyllase [Oculatella sp. FACHB-28]|uniref:alpha/beta hydrolase family protein n=1 Tax=Oculatella sp. FACHB-28 TaxID=2692845 RepID=UPI0016890E76|nr:chlorophyllase [Oculatella sp. FACHB-28]MBD2057637.1 chlorophyllase [Oculatella sp. FACHB-28]